MEYPYEKLKIFGDTLLEDVVALVGNLRNSSARGSGDSRLAEYMEGCQPASLVRTVVACLSWLVRIPKHIQCSVCTRTVSFARCGDSDDLVAFMAPQEHS